MWFRKSHRQLRLQQFSAMADTNSQVQSVQFSVNWTIKGSDFDKLSSSSETWIYKPFITSYNNVPFLWKAQFIVRSSDSWGIGFFLEYSDGPIEKFANMEYACSLMKSDFSIAKKSKPVCYDATRSSDWGWRKFFDGQDPLAIRAKYELNESDPLLFRITLKIPVFVFDYAPIATPPIAPQKWMTDLFADIQDPDKSVFWNAKLISRDGGVFYCHKVFAYQSEALQALFRHPTPGKPENEYEFDFGSASLKALVQFLHTGQADVADMTTKDLIELGNAAEMYNFKALKEACAVALWKEVVNNPDSCAKILRFAYLHDDLKDLKHRAMDVMAENYDKLSADDDNDNIFDDAIGKRLRKELLLFMSRRIEPNSPA